MNKGLTVAAHYRCLSEKCGHEYLGAPGPQQRPDGGGCPKCGHLYLKWVNCNQMFGIKRYPE